MSAPRIEPRAGYDPRTLTFACVLADKANRLEDKVFLTYLPDGRAYTYRDIDRITNCLANGLLDIGVGHGDHVAVLMENSPEILLMYFALAKIGAVSVLLNTAARGEQLKYFINHSDAVALVCDSALLTRWNEVRDDARAIKNVVVVGDAPDTAGVGYHFHEYALLEGGSERAPDVTVAMSDLASILYTSGTTGPSKGVMMLQAQSLLWPISNVEVFGYTPSDVYYVCLPLFHVNALHGSALVAFMADGAVALAPRFSASRFWEHIRHSGATGTNLLGSMTNFLWSAPPTPADRDHSMKLIRMVPTPTFTREFENRFGVRIVGGYGLSDYGVPVSLTVDTPTAKLGSAGRVRRGWELRIVDDLDFDVPPGEVGEIIVRCNLPWEMTAGYYKMPDQTLAAMRNNWFHTGDRGRLDEAGYLWFEDRIKDSIRRRGENISSWEVEQVLLKHPAIMDAAAYPVRSDLSEDEVAVAVVLRPDMTVTEEGLLEHCLHNMAHFMVPRFIQFLPDLPRTPTQKVEKAKLRIETEAKINAIWDREKSSFVVKR